jgi:hypothetical protein
MNKILEYMALEKAIVQFDLVEGPRSAGDAAVYARPNDVGDLAAKIVALLTIHSVAPGWVPKADSGSKSGWSGATRLRACWMRIAERCQSDIGRFEDATGHRLQRRAFPGCLNSGCRQAQAVAGC